jgi:lysophosphatidate acyltransferase
MTLFNLVIIAVIVMIIIIYLLVHYVLNERQLFQLKHTFYVGLVILYAIILQPIYILRPRNTLNIRLAAILLNPLLRLFGLKYRVENAQVLDDGKPCIIVANHQSLLDFIGMMHIWPEHVRYCTILAKKELLWVGPFGFSSWLAGVEFIDRKNREKSKEKMRQIMKKIQTKSLRVWMFPEGKSIAIH